MNYLISLTVNKNVVADVYAEFPQVSFMSSEGFTKAL